MSEHKIIVPTGVMSNLVGKVCFVWRSDTLIMRGIVVGKVEPMYYLVQAIGAMDGVGTSMQIYHIDEMIGWEFWEDGPMAGEAYYSYLKNRENLFEHHCAIRKK